MSVTATPATSKVTSARTVAAALVMALVASLIAGLSPAAASPTTSDVLADFEGGEPEGWFVFKGGSTVETSTQVVGDADPLAKPGQVDSDEVLTVDFNITDFGGFGQDTQPAPADWSNYASFDFWFYGTGSGAVYRVEISDNRSDPAADTSERFAHPVVDDVAGWRFVSIPFQDFVRSDGYQPAGAPNDGFGLTEVWAWAIVLPGGVADTVHFDEVGLGRRVIDDFESGLPEGTNEDGAGIGFVDFTGAGATISKAIETTPPAPTLPGPTAGPNSVLRVDVDSSSFAGFVHAFENEAVDTWVSQDWSRYEGFSVWFHGPGNGGDLFIDLLENRNPDHENADTAERWTYTFKDDVAGWRLLEIPFSQLTRKDVIAGAPDDGLLLLEVHGWAFGTLGTDGPETYYFDDASLYGVGQLAPLAASFADGITNISEGTTGDVTVRLNRPFVDEDPDQVSVQYSTEPGTAEPGRDYVETSGELVFERGGPSELTFAIETFGDDKYLGNKRIVLRLTDPVDVELNSSFQASAIIVDDDPYERQLVDDFEYGAYLFDGDGLDPAVTELTSGDAAAVPGQGAYERVLDVVTPVLGEIGTPIVVDIDLPPNGFCGPARRIVPVSILTTDFFDAASVDHTTVRVGAASEAHVKRRGDAHRHLEDVDGDGDLDLLVHVRVGDTGYDCETATPSVTGETFDGKYLASAPESVPTLGRDFTLPQDWSRDEAISFWFHGSGGGEEIGVTLKDNAAPEPGPTGWELAWSDEFDGSAGTAPNEANWTHEIGDVTPDGKNGWGNTELQYYTDSTENSAHDGSGNLVITLDENTDETLQCYYGTCEYTSARLLSWHKSEFAYGRVETSLKLPADLTTGDLRGLWPAFWSLGTDIDRTPWPAAGEIDIMEWIGREQDEIFGTIHGPGYSGGASFGGITPLSGLDEFHEFAIEWEPDEIRWYLDEVPYHTATPADVAPNEWVFDKPFFLLLNFAIGGNFGGPVGDEVTFPRDYVIDYVRIYEAPDTAERFEASFTDDAAGWQQITIPYSEFSRSADQPAGAPDDGLTLEEVNGYGFSLLDGGTSDGALRIDQVRRVAAPAPTEFEVTTLEDGAKGSLRDAIDYVADGGTVTIDPALAGATIVLENGPIVVDGKSVTVVADDLTIDGGDRDRVLIVEGGSALHATGVTLTNGTAQYVGGCVLNNGSLTLVDSTVSGCTMTTDWFDQFWQGGGGIYSGDGATLHLQNAEVVGNQARWSGGGVYSFFNTTTVIENSTIAGNVSNDVGGGLRILGNLTVDDSFIADNEATGWYGGAAFLTDGETAMSNTVVSGNVSPPWAPAALFVGTFGDSAATLNLSTTAVVDNVSAGCFLAPFGGGAVAINSDGTNVFQDDTCYPVTGDIVDGVVVELSP